MKNLMLNVLCINRSSLLKLVVSSRSQLTTDGHQTQVTLFVLSGNCSSAKSVVKLYLKVASSTDLLYHKSGSWMSKSVVCEWFK